MKICTKCGLRKALTEFRWKRDNRVKAGGYYIARCRDCLQAIRRIRYELYEGGNKPTSLDTIINPNEIIGGVPGSMKYRVLRLPRGHPMRERFFEQQDLARYMDGVQIRWEQQNDLSR